MRRNLVLPIVLCLAIAALGMGAAPASAAGGCECHTAVPTTAGAPAAHAPLVVGVTDCAACHVGVPVPHVGALTAAISFMRGKRMTAGYRLTGQAYDILSLGNSVKRADATVYLQQRAPGEVAFTDLGHAVTNKYGNFGFTVAKPTPYAYYRAVVQGGIIPSRIALPSICRLRPSPRLTLALDRGAVTPGVVARGRARPADMAGGTILFKVQKWMKPKWVKVFVLDTFINGDATYSWTYGISKGRGLYRMRVLFFGTSHYAAARSPWRQWREE